ncbi:MAG: hypothetical protein COV44_01885, partial [Deltaproteobacteria bacterium CG11_big_fil_rev_8_21_14_0_20_45_16]
RSLIGKMLRELGFKNIQEASNGEMAWQKLETSHSTKNPIQLVLCDWLIPKIKGLDLLKMSRFDERFKNVPFVFITSESGQKQVEQALESGVSHYVVTPFTADQIKMRLEETYDRIFGSKTQESNKL